VDADERFDAQVAEDDGVHAAVDYRRPAVEFAR